MTILFKGRPITEKKEIRPRRKLLGHWLPKGARDRILRDTEFPKFTVYPNSGDSRLDCISAVWRPEQESTNLEGVIHPALTGIYYGPRINEHLGGYNFSWIDDTSSSGGKERK